jgi:AraC-like DNA-binding protein
LRDRKLSPRGRASTTPRGLQRHLQEGGTTYCELVTDLRLELAMKYLNDPVLSVNDAASMLGYAQVSCFSRAFHQWTGRTPREFRRTRP